MDNDRARRIASLSMHEGFHDLMADLQERIIEAKDELFHAMASRPETLTGKKCLSLAAKAKALEDFRDSIMDDIKLVAK